MLTRPDKETLLAEVARFLEEQVKPALDNPGLSYRALVAASLLRSLALEVKGDPSGRELARLQRLAPGVEDAQLLATLRDRIRGRALDQGTARATVVENLRDELKVTSPRFDPDARVE